MTIPVPLLLVLVALVSLALGVLLALVFAMSGRRRPRGAATRADPSIIAVRQMLAQRDADLLRSNGQAVPDEPHGGRDARPRGGLGEPPPLPEDES